MRDQLKDAFKKEMHLASQYYLKGEYDDCFHHLERAHILGQRYYISHVISHWWMLKVGWKRVDLREMVGQLLRILASIGSVLGWVPIGNTGGAYVSAIKPMPLPKDIALLLKDEKEQTFWRTLSRTFIFISVISLAMQMFLKYLA